MTEPDPQTNSEPQVSTSSFRTSAEPDFILQSFAKAAQDGAIERLGVTLTVSGVVITGNLVGRDEWWRQMGEWMDTKADGMGAVARVIGEELASGDTDVPSVPIEAYGYIHLRDAWIIGPKVQVNEPMFWRGRLADVSGWALGVISQD